jgi:DNA-binding CsgD family transcriptional regulator
MTHKGDCIEVVEKAYALEGDQQAWLYDLAATVGLCFSGSSQIAGYTFQLGRSNVELGNHNPIDFDSIVALGLDRRSVVAMARAAPEGGLFPHERTQCSTLSAQLAGQPELLSETDQQRQRMAGQGDMIGIVGADPGGSGVCLFIAMDRPTRLAPRAIGHWTRVAAHLVAGLRLRRTLSGLDPRLAVQPEGREAVITPAGRVEHAEGPARGEQARRALCSAARAVDRARTTLRREDCHLAIRLWKGLVAGRWTLAEQFDADGRRHYVAHRNPPHANHPRALSEREQQVVAYAAQGLSDKLIAYHLGLAASTIASLFASARVKLGVASRAELVQLAGTLARQALNTVSD